ncbi:MAG: hypothetical protein GTN84_08515 [Hydrogenophaga sp.]|uniref:hypothetical protein n=1 Tax=Hydrogenophaga sp. TaxID=1904254 RepID=UPI0016961106|nr:hypothetical protein [Hydrogenophaga sp.]NIM41134.1 hypothetical protein [Hydrogenophaga sp.]NIN26450.1 hypothetical protein [Hydrogenophaga sp.]NIN31325.1 hypothetical protein [Hydrogenophaga sp.]NIN55380.1 hypothetical protein [Hydrogenophaga sp.]NIO51715.1 hypothetical protein [Hydrogenophaga sp.]
MPSPHPPSPPRPPEYRREVRLGALEWIGIPALALLPVLALSGALGPAHTRQVLQAPNALWLDVSHPARLRHLGSGHLVVTVTNTAAEGTQDLSLAFDEAYLAHFSSVDSVPAPDAISSGRARVSLPALAPGERASVHLRLQPDDWGLLKGWVELNRPGQPTLARLDFSTTVLP